MALLSQMFRTVAITGRTDTVNAWFAERQGGRWAEQTVRDAFPTGRMPKAAGPLSDPATPDPDQTLRDDGTARARRTYRRRVRGSPRGPDIAYSVRPRVSRASEWSQKNSAIVIFPLRIVKMPVASAPASGPSPLARQVIRTATRSAASM